MRGVQGSEPVTLGAAFGYLTQASGSRRCGRACSGSGLQTPDLPHRTWHTAGNIPAFALPGCLTLQGAGRSLRLVRKCNYWPESEGSGPASVIQRAAMEAELCTALP
jgi:hypothetical protein